MGIRHGVVVLTGFHQVCNFTNAIFFWAFLPETAKRPLEEMRYLFTEAPIFIPGMDTEKFRAGADLERRVEEVQHKQVAE